MERILPAGPHWVKVRETTNMIQRCLGIAAASARLCDGRGAGRGTSWVGDRCRAEEKAIEDALRNAEERRRGAKSRR